MAVNTPAAPADGKAFDELWSHAVIYQDKHNPYLEEFKLRGRYQGQFWGVDDAHGNPSAWEDRRTRFGFDAKLFENQFQARLEFQSNDGFADFYDGLTDAYIKWTPQSWLSITAGKQKPFIGHYDWLQSTNNQPTFERSQIFNQLNISRATGLTVEGAAGDASWRAGICSNSTPSSTGGTGAWGDGEFGDLDGGVAYSLGGGYDITRLLEVDKAEWRLDWLHSERKPGDLVLALYDDIISSTLWVQDGPASLVVEAYHATGGDRDDSDVFGFFIEPTYEIIPQKLQLVGRYSYADSTGPLGVVAQPRYERVVAGNKGKGDRYDAIYGGLQYFIYGDQLKLMAGAEWATLNNEAGDSYDGFTFLTGVRLYF